MERDRRGFASMDRQRQREIASKGGRSAHEKGKAHEFTTDQARAAGRKGGLATSRDRKHMASIGQKGGQAVSRDRAHMAEIGKKGGLAVGETGTEVAKIEHQDGWQGDRDADPEHSAA